MKSIYDYGKVFKMCHRDLLYISTVELELLRTLEILTNIC